jgi:membrane dipeptidase
MEPYLLVDAHQDLAWNMQAFGRDYSRPVAETRQLEEQNRAPALEHQGHTLLGWREFQQARLALIFGTLFVTPGRLRQTWETLFYDDSNQAQRLYQQQLDRYHELVDVHPDKFRLVGSRADLQGILANWQDDAAETHPVGLVPLMEGAEGIRSIGELEAWWQRGVRIIGLAWAGNRYCGGTREPGPLTEDGRQLLKAMAGFGFILDISHMDELAARQSLDLYPGAVIASHANAAAIIRDYSGNRHLSDEVIRALIARQGVMGLVLSCRFLDYRWQKGDPRQNVSLELAAAHVDHVCQMGGSAANVGLGSDFDGGFGLQAVPGEVDTIADLLKLAPFLTAKGYPEQEIAAILGGNWIAMLQAHLPQ